jgi:ribosome-binding ATPase YchF (GTP1/OBG family)
MLIGIVGKPSTGKSTFFKAATLAEVETAPYPFTTIKANEAIGYVRVDCVEKQFGVKCNPREGFCLKGQRFVPVKLLDVAGLVPGAHKGLGLGNQFLDDLRQADALIHVVDASGSTNEKGEQVSKGSYDPLNDIKFLEEELDMWFFNILNKNWQKFLNQSKLTGKQIDKAIAEQFSGLKIDLNMVKKTLLKLNLKHEKAKEWSKDELFKFTSELRKISKPMVIAANKMDISGSEDNIKKMIETFREYKIIPCSAESELALREAAKKELIDYIPGDPEFTIKNPDKFTAEQETAARFIKEVIKQWKSTGVQQTLNTAVYNLLNYITIFPGGVNNLKDSQGRVLPDAFLLPPGSTALNFAYHLHSDFGDNFIRAIDVKTKKTIGKEHKLKEGDVIEIIAKT